MRTRIFIGLVLLLLGLTFLVAGGVLAAKKSRVPLRGLAVDGAEPPGKYVGPSPVLYEGGMQPDCGDINPVEPIVVLQHDQFGSTYYDYQKNGSMGRMIAVGPAGHRHMCFHETRGPYSTEYPRFLTYNCKNPLDQWCAGDTGYHVDGGTGINAGYGQALLLHDGTELLLFHRQGTPPWHSTVARGEIGYPCQCNIIKLYDIPDEHDNPSSGTPNGYWPKGCVVYDADSLKDYIHVVTTQSTGGTGQQTNAYQRCYFDGDNLICVSPGYGPYTMTPGNYYGARDIAVIDEIMTISSIAVSSPVSKRVAIVYTKNRDAYATQINNDVVYIESDSNGNDWLSGTQWPPVIHNVTNYPPGNGPRAYTDVAACYDYNDSLHIVWNAHDYDSIAGTVTYRADLYHWSKEHQISMIAAGPEPEVGHEIHPGSWNRTISKPSISAKDPIYHPDSVFLFCTWTQFNKDDLSAGNMTNGEIYAAVSPDSGRTWTAGWNLTNTQTPDCAPGECLSEHWSSMAENMHNGDLHIEYVCDRDAGGAVKDEGTWTDNPMMYLHIDQLPPISKCGVSIKLLDPPDWCDPPLKVLPGEGRVIAMELTGLYNLGGPYEVTCAHPNVEITQNPSGELLPGEKVEVNAAIFCPGEEEFINAIIEIHVCIGMEDDTTYEITLHAVCSDDYYECDRDPRTYIEKDNCKLKLWACANTEERVWDKRIEPEENRQVIFSGGVIVATTADNDTVVGRQDYSDTRTGARDTINVVVGSMEPYFPAEPCTIQKIHVKDTYIWTTHLDPPNDFKWWWIDIHKQIILFHGPDCPNWKKEQVIKYVWMDWSAPPVWWPDPGVYDGYEDIYVGMFADVDAPFDEGCNGCNTAGYDYEREMIWQHGWYNDTLPEGHPEYENHYVGLALTDPSGAVVAPWGCQNVLNENYLYPQQGWGWKEGELYQLAATPGVNIHHPDSVADRAVVLTAEMIPAGTDTAFEEEFILIEAFIPTGLADLQAHIDTTREVLIPELSWHGLFEKQFPICGDVNDDRVVNVADPIYLKSYLFICGPPPPWPMNRADVNNDDVVDIGDLVGLVNYLFLPSHPALHCSGFGRE